MHRFKTGLSTLGVLDAMKAHTVLFKSLLCYNQQTVTPEMLEALFEPVLSPPGSNKRHLENRTTAWWNDFILHVDGRLLIFTVIIFIVLVYLFHTSTTWMVSHSYSYTIVVPLRHIYIQS
jgi:hypothetical protein